MAMGQASVVWKVWNYVEMYRQYKVQIEATGPDFLLQLLSIFVPGGILIGVATKFGSS